MGIKHVKLPEVSKVARLLSEGNSIRKTAKIVGRAPATIARVKSQHPEIIQAVADKYKTALLMEVQPSVERIVQLRDEAGDKVALAAAQDLLNRAENHLGKNGNRKVTMIFHLNQAQIAADESDE